MNVVQPTAHCGGLERSYLGRHSQRTDQTEVRHSGGRWELHWPGTASGTGTVVRVKPGSRLFRRSPTSQIDGRTSSENHHRSALSVVEASPNYGISDVGLEGSAINATRKGKPRALFLPLCLMGRFTRRSSNHCRYGEPGPGSAGFSCGQRHRAGAGSATFSHAFWTSWQTITPTSLSTQRHRKVDQT
jgi:hypothetical protein